MNMARIVVGIQPVREAIRAHGARLQKLIVRMGGPESDALAALARFARSQGIAVEQADDSALRSLAGSAHHQGAVAIAPQLAILSLDAVLSAQPTLIVILDRITDPQNFGAIVRSSVAFGADAIVWPEHANAPLTPATFRASAGAVEHARLCRVGSLQHAMQVMRDSGLVVVALAEDASAVSLDEIDLTAPTAIVVGSEGEGIRRSLRRACDFTARLPTQPPLPTLNASAAAAVALFETRRQRQSAARAHDAAR